MWRRLKIWNFLGKILFLNIFLLRKWVSKIFKATCFGKNLLISQWLNNLQRKRSTSDAIVSKNSEIFKGRMDGKKIWKGGNFKSVNFYTFYPPPNSANFNQKCVNLSQKVHIWTLFYSWKWKIEGNF